MRRFRFTIAGLLGAVVCVAVAVAALRAADDAWDSGVFGLTLLTLATAVLLAVHRTGRRRAYWLGFALFGGVYLGASLVPPIASRLPSTKGLAYLDSKVEGRRTIVEVNDTRVFKFIPLADLQISSRQVSQAKVYGDMAFPVLGGPNGSTENFVRIGHSLLALVLACVGGLLSRSLHAGRSGPATMPGVEELG